MFGINLMTKMVKKKKKDFSLKEEYQEAFSFLSKSRDFVYATILLFFIFGVIGFFFEDIVNQLFNSLFGVKLSNTIFDYIQKILLETEGMNYGQLFGYIFFRNLQSSLFGILLGIIFGIFPLIAIIANGYLLGFVAFISVKANGIFVLWRILPHGIFELPAVFISIGLGLRLGFSMFSSKERASFKNYFVNSLRVFLLIVFPLLVIAAIIEAGLILLTG